MAANYSLCLGTAGWGVWHSPDAGQSWTRHRAPFPLNSRIQALIAHPTQARTVIAGGDTGLFVSHDGGARWERIGADGVLPTIWSLAVDPVDPQILFAGTRPAGVYRSRDGGQQWEKLAVDIAPECSIGIPFVTGLVVDPDDHRIVWAGVEIDGVFRSMDGGDTWTHLKTGLYDPDIHAVTIAATRPKRLYASTAAKFSPAATWARPGSPWTSARNGRSPMPAASWSRPMIPACCSPGVERRRRAKRGTCSAPPTSGRPGRSCRSPPSRMPLCGALPRIPPTPTALSRSACSVKCTSR